MTLIKKIVAYALVLVLFHAEVGYSFPFRNPRPLQGSHWLTLTPGCHQKLARKYKKNPHTKSSIGRKLLYPLLLSGGLVGGCMLYEQCSMPPDRASSVDYDANSLGEKSIKVVTIGDSLTTSFSVKGGDLSSILQSRLKPKNENWALDDREENSIHSEYERLDSVPREFINISTPRASVDDPGVFHNSIPTKLIMKVSDLSDQVYQTASLKPFPNIIQIWIGNNNIDWVYEVKTLTKLPKDYDVYVDPFKIADRHRKKMVEAVLKKYKEELHKLILKANIQKYNVAIVVFSLPNIDSYLEGMDRAMALHQKDEKNFPYIEFLYEHFESFMPLYRHKTSELAKEINNGIKNLVTQLNADSGSNAKIFFLNLNDLRMDNPNLFAPDGFHLSGEGHNLISGEATYFVGKEVLPFVLKKDQSQ